ncbi:hypothetical protein [Roseospira navarrensis]|uniref:Uncharacterized protein n=1 Tax=Roseospira navarrensis TaxID=140058 RepID=A0A7X2D4S4_9PROT|nr:hypothetical protein [Roseospira navarrensis]MQX38228.1 hypothetical protein [Roseospira navarrensis]
MAGRSMLKGLALVCGLVAAGSGPAVAQTAPPLVHVRPVEVIDRQGFDRPLTAYTLMVPTHWQATGGVQWDPSNACNRSGYNFSWKASAPDESEGVAILPAITWTSQPGGPCPQLQVNSARDLLSVIVNRTLPNARVLDYRARPDLARDLQALSHREDYGSMSYQMTVDAGELLIGFIDERGREMRGSVAAAMTLWRIDTPSLYGLPGSSISGGQSLPGFVAAAEAGRLDLRVAEMIRKSIRPGPEWSRRIAQHHAVLNRQNTRHASRMAQITSQTNSEISDMIHQGYRDRAAISDRGQRERVEAIRGVETYDDPINGGTVQLDNTYRHAWQLRDGTYVLTDDAFFNPQQYLGMDGQPLQATR